MMRLAFIATLLMLLLGCGGGGGSSDNPANLPASSGSASDQTECDGNCADAVVRLSEQDIQQILAQGIAEAEARGALATLAVVDRVGNVLAVHRMNPEGQAVEIASEFPTPITTGLEGLILPAAVPGDGIAAISKALTGAYLSSEGNAFSSRTASQIVQEHFNPGERNQPGGPLFGVQFSQLSCSDFTVESTGTAVTVGPQRSPLGLSADPGGFPLYKQGTLVGGVGVIADGRYSLDKNILDTDEDVDEAIALAATFGFAAPDDRRGDRLTIDGKTFRFSDINYDDLRVSPEQAAPYAEQAGELIAVIGYTDGNIRPGTAFGQAESGIRAATNFPNRDAFVFVDANGDERFPPLDGVAIADGTAPLSASEVTTLLDSALAVANRARAQIRRPRGTHARVTISVVDTQGRILGMARSRDAPVFGADVSLQKARTATLFSSTDAADFLRGIDEEVVYLSPDLSEKTRVSIPSYVDAVQGFVGAQALTDGTAFSDRAGGNLSRPFFPDGIEANTHGPLSKSFVDNEWSVFSTGLQLDLSFNRIITHVTFALGVQPNDATANCVAATPRIANGTQIFPGSVPIYRGDRLIGGIGVSGDGVDQDDMIAFLGVHETGLALGGALGNAPPAMRADQLSPGGTQLRYVQCPQAPFVDSDEERVCDGK